MQRLHSVPLARPRAASSLIVLLAGALLSACVAASPSGQATPGQGGGTTSAPTRVVLYRDTVTVEMRDKSLCTGPRNASGPVWSGTLAGCRHRWPYEVRQPSGRFVRLPMQQGAGGAGQVSLTPPSGAPQIWSAPTLRVGS